MAIEVNGTVVINDNHEIVNAGSIGTTTTLVYGDASNLTNIDSWHTCFSTTLTSAAEYFQFNAADMQKDDGTYYDDYVFIVAPMFFDSSHQVKLRFVDDNGSVYNDNYHYTMAKKQVNFAPFETTSGSSSNKYDSNADSVIVVPDISPYNGNTTLYHNCASLVVHLNNPRRNFRSHVMKANVVLSVGQFATNDLADRHDWVSYRTEGNTIGRHTSTNYTIGGLRVYISTINSTVSDDFDQGTIFTLYGID